MIVDFFCCVCLFYFLLFSEVCDGFRVLLATV